jgi:hypothetical protein
MQDGRDEIAQENDEAEENCRDRAVLKALALRQRPTRRSLASPPKDLHELGEARRCDGSSQSSQNSHGDLGAA